MPDKKAVTIPVLSTSSSKVYSSKINKLGKDDGKKKEPVEEAKLTYNAAAQRLTGSIGNIYFDEQVFSGGSRGHKKVDEKKAKLYLHDESDSLESFLSTTKETKDKKGNYVQRGGSLPPGHYICRYQGNHPTFRECIFLAQKHDAMAIISPFASTAIVHGRGGFFIHGKGPKGSDGCLVFQDESRRLSLNKAIKSFKGVVILEVTHVSYMLPAEIGGYIS